MFTVDVKQQSNKQQLVQSDIGNDLILFGGHCDLYIMVQRFCLVSLTIFNKKTSYRSVAGGILVVPFALSGARGMKLPRHTDDLMGFIVV